MQIFSNRKTLMVEPSIYLEKCKFMQDYLLSHKACDITTDDDECPCDVLGEPIPQPYELKPDYYVIPVFGVIDYCIPQLYKMFGFVDLDDIEKQLDNAVINYNNVILHFRSPGGNVQNVPELAAKIGQYQKQGKNIIAYSDTLMCSAAYYLAAGASQILVKGGSTLIGNVGVYTAFVDATEYYKEAGLQVQVFKSGEYKAMGYEGTSLTDKQKEEIQLNINSDYDRFVNHILTYRTIKSEYLQGQVYNGYAATELGFCDGYSTLETIQ